MNNYTHNLTTLSNQQYDVLYNTLNQFKMKYLVKLELPILNDINLSINNLGIYATIATILDTNSNNLILETSNKMQEIYILQDNVNIGYSTIILNFLSVISIICAIYIIISKNPIISILYLIALFISIACYLIIIGINFIGLSYILIYIGAVSILFIFILMLINIRISELVSNNVNSVPLVIIISLVINSILYNNIAQKNIIFNILNYKFDYSLWKYLNQEQIFNVLNAKWDSNIINDNNINSLGNIIYTNFSILLILASVILLLGMIGAIVITIKPQSLNFKHKNNKNHYNKNNII